MNRDEFLTYLDQTDGIGVDVTPTEITEPNPPRIGDIIIGPGFDGMYLYVNAGAGTLEWKRIPVATTF